MPLWMVVEDEEYITDTILSMLELWGISGFSFTDGEQVARWLANIERQKSPTIPELTLLDIRLPKIDGIHTAIRLRQSKRLKSMAIILMTAYRLSPDGEAQILRDTQADRLIYKPFPALDSFRQLLEDVLKKRKSS
jgi:CheY-like chemotaxis protein